MNHDVGSVDRLVRGVAGLAMAGSPLVLPLPSRLLRPFHRRRVTGPVLRHLGRGVFGGGALAAAVAMGSDHPLLAILLIPVALLAFRGCPMCWTLGLVQACSAPEACDRGG